MRTWIGPVALSRRSPPVPAVPEVPAVPVVPPRLDPPAPAVPVVPPPLRRRSRWPRRTRRAGVARTVRPSSRPFPPCPVRARSGGPVVAGRTRAPARSSDGARDLAGSLVPTMADLSCAGATRVGTDDLGAAARRRAQNRRQPDREKSESQLRFHDILQVTCHQTNVAPAFTKFTNWRGLTTAMLPSANVSVRSNQVNCAPKYSRANVTELKTV